MGEAGESETSARGELTIVGGRPWDYQWEKETEWPVSGQ